MSNANKRQVAGAHYNAPIQHWDIVQMYDLGYFDGQATKYLLRWRKKNGIEDLRKAVHFIEKLIEIENERLDADLISKIDRNHG